MAPKWPPWPDDVSEQLRDQLESLERSWPELREWLMSPERQCELHEFLRRTSSPELQQQLCDQLRHLHETFDADVPSRPAPSAMISKLLAFEPGDTASFDASLASIGQLTATEPGDIASFHASLAPVGDLTAIEPADCAEINLTIASKRKRKEGGGRASSFTPQQEAELQREYRRLKKEKPAAFKYLLRDTLQKYAAGHFGINVHVDTINDRIMKPVDKKRRRKI